MKAPGLLQAEGNERRVNTSNATQRKEELLGRTLDQREVRKLGNKQKEGAHWRKIYLHKKEGDAWFGEECFLLVPHMGMTFDVSLRMRPT
jgi:hypothetical protein